MPSVDLRCPIGPGRLLAKIKAEGGVPTYTDDNLIELPCVNCRKFAHPGSHLVVHRFNILGELIETVVDPDD